MARGFTRVMVLLLAATAASPVLAECSAGEVCESDDVELLSIKQAMTLGKSKGKTTTNDCCFSASLAEDTQAVAGYDSLAEQAAASSATAGIRVCGDTVSLHIDYKVPGTDATNPVIGMHIHAGNVSENGGILVGFCGEGPLPPFSGTCKQGDDVNNFDIEGAVVPGTTLTDTIAEAAVQLCESSADAAAKFYLNLHTQNSFNLTHGLGLIRGQLQSCACAIW